MDMFTGKQYLMIDIANSFGLDKENWDVRIKWYEDNKHQLDKLVSKAKEPAMFYAGVQAMKKVEAKQPIGYPISLDATSSGLQILAALTGDEKAGRLCNVIDAGKRMDAYVELFHIMKHNMSQIDSTAAGKLERDDLKQAIMTSLYGSEKIPKLVFGEGVQLRCFFATMKTEAPLAWSLNEAFLSLWNPDATEYNWVLPDGFHVRTKVMDVQKEVVHFNNNKYEVSYKVNRAKEKGRSLGANTIHSLDGMMVREITRRCDYNPARIAKIEEIINTRETFVFAPLPTRRHDDHLGAEDDKMVENLWDLYMQSGYLSARILDHLDMYNIYKVDIPTIEELIATLPKKPFKVVSVHDCFRVLPTYGNDLRIQYNLQLMLLNKSDVLSYLLRQITGNKNMSAPKGNLNPDDILNSNYALS